MLRFFVVALVLAFALGGVSMLVARLLGPSRPQRRDARRDERRDEGGNPRGKERRGHGQNRHEDP